MRPVLDIGAKQVAEDAAEVLVARIGEKAAGIGEHADEAAEEAEVGEGVDLPLHGLLLIEEPPAAAELHFAGDGAVLEVAEQGAEGVVVGGIEVVDDDLGQCAGALRRSR